MSSGRLSSSEEDAMIVSGGSVRPGTLALCPLRDGTQIARREHRPGLRALAQSFLRRPGGRDAMRAVVSAVRCLILMDTDAGF